ncbi:MAG: hypothetical protein AAF957_28970 [Planctomycetota bacterium]
MPAARLLLLVAVAALLVGGLLFRQSSSGVSDGDADVVERASATVKEELASVEDVALEPSAEGVEDSSTASDGVEPETPDEEADRPEHEAVLRLVASRLGDALDALPAEARAAGSRRVARRTVQVVTADSDTVEIRVDVPLVEELSGGRRKIVCRLDLRSGAALTVEWTPFRDESRTEALGIDPSWMDQRAAPVVVNELAPPPTPTASGRPVPRAVHLRALAEIGERVLVQTRNLRVTASRSRLEWSESVRGTTATIDGVPLGDEILVTWQRADAMYARRTFIHDGRPVTMSLLGPARVQARFVDPLGTVVRELERVTVDFRSTTEKEFAIAWSGARREVDEDGVHRLSVPERVPRTAPSAEFSEELSRRGWLVVQSRGFHDLEIPLELEPGRTIELGDVALEFDGLIVHVRHSEAPLEEPSFVQWDESGVTKHADALLVRSLRPGVSAVVLSRRAQVLLTGDRPDAVLFAGARGSPWGARADGEDYAAVPTVDVDALIDASMLDPKPARGALACEWEGMVLELGPIEEGVTEVDWALPAEGCEVFWTEARLPPERSARHRIGPAASLSGRRYPLRWTFDSRHRRAAASLDPRRRKFSQIRCRRSARVAATPR